MYKLISYYLFIIFCLCGCVGKSKPIVNLDVVRITANPKNSEKQSMEKLFSSIELIPLENSTEALLHRCDKMLFYNDKYYLLSRKSSSLFIFNSKGVFLGNSKHKKGDGPGEYYCIVDFNISEEGYIEILDVSAYKIRKYDDEFNLISEINLPKDIYPINTFKPLTNELYAFYSSSSTDCGDELKIYSFKENRIVESIKGLISDPSLRVSATQPYSFYEFEKDVFFSFPYTNDKIYKIDRVEGKITEVVNYDFGKYAFPFVDIAAHPSVLEDVVEASDKYAFPIYRSENRNVLFTFIIYRGQQHLLLYEKNTKKSALYSCTFKGGKILLPPAFVDDNYLYVVAEPDWLEVILSEKLLTDSCKDRMTQFKEDDNCTIVRYRLSNPF